MKIVQINAVCGFGSTGKICVGISRVLSAQGIENYILYSLKDSDFTHGIKCAESNSKIQALRSRVFGNYGFNSTRTTKKLIAELDRIDPDVVHLHNLHSHNCNLALLMDYFRKRKTKLVWTFHDCWVFTAYCTHFVREKCEKWKTGCHHCVQHKSYSWFFDRSKWLYAKKKEVFRGLDLTIVTPSQWMADLVRQSFLQDYPIKVINNGINLDIFQPCPSNFREKYGISKDAFILLGVAIKWLPAKGADIFIRLAKLLDSEKFRIVMVGTDDQIDKLLPSSIISIHRTAIQKELAEIYTAADLFVNPTREDTFPTVNMESLACGTPVVTFDTGGSPEILDENTGKVVPCDDEAALVSAILDIEKHRPFATETCRSRAMGFSEKQRFQEYRMLYEVIN